MGWDGVEPCQAKGGASRGVETCGVGFLLRCNLPWGGALWDGAPRGLSSEGWGP